MNCFFQNDPKINQNFCLVPPAQVGKIRYTRSGSSTLQKPITGTINNLKTYSLYGKFTIRQLSKFMNSKATVSQKKPVVDLDKK